MIGEDYTTPLTEPYTISGLPYNTPFLFKVVPAEGLSIDYVGIEDSGESVFYDTTTGVYTIAAEQMNTSPTITIVCVDAKYELQCNLAPEVTVKYLYDGDETSVSGNDRISDLPYEDLEFTVETQAGYEVHSISVNGVEPDDTYKPAYTIPKETIAAGATLTITVKEMKHSLDYSIDEGAKILYGEDFATTATGSGIINGLSYQDDFQFLVEVESDYDLAEVILNGTPVSVSDNLYTISANELQTEDVAELVATVTDREPVSGNRVTFENVNHTVITYGEKYATGIKYDGKEYSGDNNIIFLKQTANTTKTYKMTVLGVDKNFNPEEDLKFNSDFVDSYSGKIRISKTAYNKFDLDVTTPYEYTDDDTFDMSVDILMKGNSEEDKTVVSIGVSNTLPTLKAPTVKVTEATETTAKLTITDSGKLKVVSGNVYFQISVKDADDAVVDLNGDADGTMLYVPAKDYVGKETIILRELTEAGLKAANYTVTARTCIGRTVNGKVEYVFDSDATNPNITKKTVALRNSAYETNLKLKKVASKIYTGQKNVVLAAPVFSKATTPEFRGIVDIWVTNLRGEKEKEDPFRFELNQDEKGNICADFGNYLAPGTYVLHATPMCPDSLYAKEATLTFKVLQGIDKLQFSALLGDNYDVTVFRANNKKVIYTLPALVYGGRFTVPANTKTTYSIAPTYKNKDTTDNLKYVTINPKTGKVTIDKKYVLPSNKANATFQVTATAADFARQDPADNVTAVMTFTIKNTKNDIPYLTLCEYEVDVETFHKVTPTDGKYFIDDAEDTQYAILATNHEIPEEGIVRSSDDIIPTSMYSLKISNKNVKCKMYDMSYVVEADTTIKNVNFTATTNDGGKKSNVIKNVTFEELPADLYYTVMVNVQKKNSTGYISVSDKEAMDASVSVSDEYNTCTVNVFASNGKGGYQKVEYTGIDYSVKTDKGLEFFDYNKNKDNDKSGIFVRFTGKNLVDGEDGTKHATGKITFTYRVDGGTTRVETLTLKNDMPWLTTQAPTIKQETAIYADDLNPEHKVTLAVQADSQYDISEKKVVIIPLASELNKKNAAFQKTYLNMCTDIMNSSSYNVTNDGKVMLSVSPTIYNYAPGTYQFEVIFGTTDNHFHVTAETKTTILSLKVSKAQSATPVTSYTMSAESPVVTLTTKKKTKDTEYSFTNIYNTNKKGVENEFLKYFKFDFDSQTISLTDAVKGETLEETQANLEALVKKTKDLQCNAYCGIKYTNKYKLVPIKIKIDTKKNADKKFTTALIQGEWYNSYDYTPISIQFNKAEADIKHVYTDEEQMTVTVDNKRVNIKGINKEKTYTLKNVNIYVVKEGSIYESFLTDLKTAADTEPTSAQKQAEYEEAMKNYGSKVILKQVTFVNIS